MGFNSGFKGLNSWTSNTDVSGYHADFREGHGTLGAGQGRGMACVNYRTACYVSIRLNKSFENVATVPTGHNGMHKETSNNRRNSGNSFCHSVQTPFRQPVSKLEINTQFKGKAIPLQAWTGPEGYMRLRLPHFKTIGT